MPGRTHVKKVKVSRDRTRWPKGVPGRLRPWIFLTFRHYKGGSQTHRPPLPQEKSLVLTFRGWVDLRAHGSRKKSPVTPPGIYPGTVRLVAQRLNLYATPSPGRTHVHSLIPWKRCPCLREEQVARRRKEEHLTEGWGGRKACNE